MPIDASIYGNLQLPKLATLGEIAEARAQREDRQMVRDSRKLAMDKQQREAKELQAIQEVFTKYTGPDGPDQTAIVNELFRIAPDAAQKVQAGFAKLKKDAADARSSELDLETKRIAAVARSLQGVTPETYPAAFSRIRVIDPEAAEVLGPTYDPAKVDAVMSSGMAWSDYNTKYKDVLAAKEKDEVKALNLISLANDQNQYEDALDFAKVHGVASKLREMGFADQFTPDVASRAAQLTMTPKDRAALAEQAADNRRQDAAQKQTEAYQNAQLGIARGNRAVAQGNLAARKAEGGATGTGKLSAAAVEKVAGAEQALSIIDDIDRMLPRFSPQLGPIAGRLAGASLTMPGVKVSQGLAEFAAQITTLKNSVIKATTGAAMSEPEAQRIMAQVPDLTNKPSVFKARMETTRRNLEMLKRRTIELSGGTNTNATDAVKPPTGRYNPATGTVE